MVTQYLIYGMYEIYKCQKDRKTDRQKNSSILSTAPITLNLKHSENISESKPVAAFEPTSPIQRLIFMIRWILTLQIWHWPMAIDMMP